MAVWATGGSELFVRRRGLGGVWKRLVVTDGLGHGRGRCIVRAGKR